MDMTNIAAAQASIKALFDLAKGATAAVVDHELKAKLIDIQGAILETQSKLGDAQAERLDLLEQLAELKTTVRKLEDGQSELSGYALVEIARGRFLYQSKEHQPPHWACPNCRSVNRLISVLQSEGGYGDGNETRYWCTACSFELFI